MHKCDAVYLFIFLSERLKKYSDYYINDTTTLHIPYNGTMKYLMAHFFFLVPVLKSAILNIVWVNLYNGTCDLNCCIY